MFESKTVWGMGELSYLPEIYIDVMTNNTVAQLKESIKSAYETVPVALSNLRKPELAAFVAWIETAKREDVSLKEVKEDMEITNTKTTQTEEAAQWEAESLLCHCGQRFIPLANGTMPRHTRPGLLDVMDRTYVPPKRERCHYSGKFPPVTVQTRSIINNSVDRQILDLKGTADNADKLKKLTAMRFNTVQIRDVRHVSEGSRKGRREGTRHVQGGTVKSRKRFRVETAA